MTKRTTGTLIIALCMIVAMVAYFGLLKKWSLNSSDIQWSYETRYIDEINPTTQVTVYIDGQKRDAGVYPGSCFERQELRKDMHEVSGIRCWWAGSGDDIGVFQEEGQFYIKHRELDEGNAEEKSFIGDFKTLFSL